MLCRRSTDCDVLFVGSQYSSSVVCVLYAYCQSYSDLRGYSDKGGGGDGGGVVVQ